MTICEKIKKQVETTTRDDMISIGTDMIIAHIKERVGSLYVSEYRYLFTDCEVFWVLVNFSEGRIVVEISHPLSEERYDSGLSKDMCLDISELFEFSAEMSALVRRLGESDFATSEKAFVSKMEAEGFEHYDTDKGFHAFMVYRLRRE